VGAARAQAKNSDPTGSTVMAAKGAKPRCPKCGEDVIKAGTARGKQRWHHGRKQREVCKWHGTQPVGLEAKQAEGIDRKATAKLHRSLVKDRREVKRYVITAAQNATPVNKAFLASLLGYCKHNGAQLICVPYRYKNPTSMWSAKAENDDWWAPELAPYLLDRRLELNKSLVILGDVKTQPTSSAPIQGYDSISGGRSAVIGHPRLELKTVPTPQSKLPKILTTTGAVTERNYIESKAGKQAEFHHTFGACIVEVKGDVFHMRQLNAVNDGSFMDLQHEYRGKTKIRVDRAAALIMGDSHVEFIDPDVVRGTFGRGGLVDLLKPEVLVWHDIHDFFSRNHHHRDEVFVNFAKHHAGTDNVREQLQKTFDFVDQATRPNTQNIFVPSNHPDALARWVKEANPKTDPRNAIFWAETFTAMCQGAKMTESGAGTIDPFNYWARRMMKSAGQTTFLHRDESFTVKGIELGYHGDKGPNGARGSIKGFSKIGIKTVTGHAHSPGVEGGAYRVGTNSRLRLEYNSGPSSWLHTDCIVYQNGKRSLINFIDGEFRA
jgi:hypothetical protein